MKNTFHRLIAGLIAASVLLCGCSSANMLTSAAAHELYDQRYSVGTASDEINAVSMILHGKFLLMQSAQMP